MSRDVSAGGHSVDSAGDDVEVAPDRSLTDADGGFDREAVVDAATPILERWERDRHVDAARGRVGSVFFASVAVLALTWLVEPGGLAGFVLQLWSFASLPIAGVTGTLYATLRNPERAREIWWDDGALLAFGLVLVAALARAAVRSPYGRVAWQLLFAESSPTGQRYGYDVDDGVDEARVAELRRYVTFAVVGSVAVIALDYVGRLLDRGGLRAVLDLLTGADADGQPPNPGGGGGGLPALPAIPTDPASIAALLVAAVVVGSIVGFFIAIRRDL